MPETLFSRIAASIGLGAGISRLERAAEVRLYSLKRAVVRTAIEMAILLFGVAAILTGLMLFLTRFAPLDIVLLISGLVLLNLVLLAGRFR